MGDLRCWICLTVLMGALIGSSVQTARNGEPDWVEAMRQVHRRFSGQKSTFAQFGDSITVTMAFWAPLPHARKNAPPEMERAFKIVNYYMRPECWRWKGPEYGVHPSHPTKYRDDYSEEALNCNGYSLRNYLVLLKYSEVIEKVLLPQQHGTANGLSPLELAFQDWMPKAPPLPPPKGEVIRVASADELFEAVQKAKPGTTILIAEGHYHLPRRLEIRRDKITLRGESGKREKVILDGGRHQLGELLAITGCSDVTIADLTIQNVRWNGIKLDTDTGVHRVTIYNCVIRNVWQRGVKGVRVPPSVPRPTGCKILYCTFVNDRPKTFEDDPTDNPQTFNGNYIGGIDVMFAQGWVISDNVFVGIQGRTREGRGAIFLWHDSRDCVIERNIVIDCDVGIALGNSWKPPEIEFHCTRVVVRNNFIVRCPESGIVADYTKDCLIAHNTIHDPTNKLGRLIRLVHENEGLRVVNNLLSGPPIKNESTSRVLLLNNLVVPDYSAAFVDALRGNLRLRPNAVEAVDKAEPLPEVKDDIDRKPRGQKPDIGAHELR